MRSDNVTKGSERAPNRSLFYALGYTPEELERALPISRLRIDAAERVLQQLGILPRPAEDAPPAPAEEKR